jgi:putative hydrolase of the HAD superfamily
VLSPEAIDAVVFDIGGVFLVPHPGLIGDALRAVGVEVDDEPDGWRRAHYVGVRALTEHLNGGGTVDERDKPVWGIYDAAHFVEVGVSRQDLELAVEKRHELRMQGIAGRIWSLQLEQNIAAFHEIVAAGVSTAILSNNDGTASEQLVEHEICQAGPGPLPSVATVIDSTVVGVAKPDPAIFDPVLDALGTDRDRTLYVGDTVHADVRGAEAAGMPVVQLDPFDLHADHDHLRLPDLAALAALFLA